MVKQLKKYPSLKNFDTSILTKMSKMLKRRKGRKNKDSPIERKSKERDGEVALARGRLAGALKGILNHNTEDSDELDMNCAISPGSNSGLKRMTRDNSPAQWKKMNRIEIEDHQSYFMKLFDRSVDLAQFHMNTPLYPICRAWIQNKPILMKKSEEGNGLLEIKHEADDEHQPLELNDKSYRSHKEEDIYNLPPPKALPEGIPTLKIPITVPTKSDDIDLNTDHDQAPSREELLDEHLKKWTKVRKDWRMASHNNEERYSASKEILTRMFERAQVQFTVPTV